MISGRVNSYKGFIHSKKVYLKRKKYLNREIKKVKKRRNTFKYELGRRYLDRVISRGKDDLDILRIMYNLEKREKTFYSQYK